MGIRRTTYFGKRKRDQEILNYIKEMVNIYDYSDLSKSLMYDGIKYRNEYFNKENAHTNVIHSHTSQYNQDLKKSNVTLEKKEIKQSDVMSKLDSF